MTCAHCGAPIPEGAAFCPACGQAVAPARNIPAGAPTQALNPYAPTPPETGRLREGSAANPYSPGSPPAAYGPPPPPAYGSPLAPPPPGMYPAPAPGYPPGGYGPPPGAGAYSPAAGYTPPNPYAPPVAGGYSGPAYPGAYPGPAPRAGNPVLMWIGAGLLALGAGLILYFMLIAILAPQDLSQTPQDVRSTQLGAAICGFGLFLLFGVPGGVLFFLGRRR